MQKLKQILSIIRSGFGKFIVGLAIIACLAMAGKCVYDGYQSWQTGIKVQTAQKNEGKLDSKSELESMSNLGSYLQGTTASQWALAGVLIIFVAFLAQLAQLEEQRKQFKIQSDSIRRQDFENKFFQLLNLHHKLVEDMEDENQAGRDCFKKWYDKLKEDYHKQKNPLRLSAGGMKLTPKRELEFTIERYAELYTGLKGDLGHYFRNLYHIIKFVDEAQDIGDELKKNYTTLVRAQLSAYEQALLFYNCIHPYGEEFFVLIERYGLFHNFDDELFLDETHEDYYDPKAYGLPARIKQKNPRLVKLLDS